MTIIGIILFITLTNTLITKFVMLPKQQPQQIIKHADPEIDKQINLIITKLTEFEQIKNQFEQLKRSEIKTQNEILTIKQNIDSIQAEEIKKRLNLIEEALIQILEITKHTPTNIPQQPTIQPNSTQIIEIPAI